MKFSEDNYKFMFAALQLAEQAAGEDEVPVGAVVVHEGKIIGRGYNQNQKLNDSTAHAEMIAITSACTHLSSKMLEDCQIYITLEPCIMCTGAILLSRIDTIYFSAYDPKFGACGSVYNLIKEDKYNHKPKVYSGLYESESRELLKNFFIEKRKK